MKLLLGGWVTVDVISVGGWVIVIDNYYCIDIGRIVYYYSILQIATIDPRYSSNYNPKSRQKRYFSPVFQVYLEPPLKR
jgi:hypothetical protein